MPKITWIKPRINHLSVLLKAVKCETHMTYRELGKLVGCSPQNAQKALMKPADRWTIGQIKLYCNALGIPYEDAVLAAIEK